MTAHNMIIQYDNMFRNTFVLHCKKLCYNILCQDLRMSYTPESEIPGHALHEKGL